VGYYCSGTLLGLGRWFETAALPVATGLAVISPGKAAEPLADKELLDLYQELRVAWSHSRSLSGRAEDITDEEWEVAFDRCSAIVRRIENCTALGLDGLRVKAIAVLWCHGGEMELNLGACIHGEHMTTDPSCSHRFDDATTFCVCCGAAKSRLSGHNRNFWRHDHNRRL
jgi:hypothetical protein